MDRRLVITVICITSTLLAVVILTTVWNRQYNEKYIHYNAPPQTKSKSVEEKESFDTESPTRVEANPRPCNVYYTKNIDICDDSINQWYKKPKDVLQTRKEELDTKRIANTISSAESAELTTINKVLSDYDTLPFKQYCKLQMYGMIESTSHPYKINTEDDAGKRGNSGHWSFCFEDSLLKNKPELKATKEFQKVFEPTNKDFEFSDGKVAKRFDMVSMANDHLLDLHCKMYENQLVERGSINTLYNGRKMLEVSFDKNTKRITGVRVVYYNNGALYVSSATDQLNALLRLFELIRQPTNVLIRPRSYKPTMYRMLFNLCNAGAVAPDPNVTDNGRSLAHPKSIELVVERQKPLFQSFIQLPESVGVDLASYGDISDMAIRTTMTIQSDRIKLV